MAKSEACLGIVWCSNRSLEVALPQSFPDFLTFPHVCGNLSNRQLEMFYFSPNTSKKNKSAGKREESEREKCVRHVASQTDFPQPLRWSSWFSCCLYFCSLNVIDDYMNWQVKWKQSAVREDFEGPSLYIAFDIYYCSIKFLYYSSHFWFKFSQYYCTNDAIDA